jgi:hypothetical protein
MERKGQYLLFNVLKFLIVAGVFCIVIINPTILLIVKVTTLTVKKINSIISHFTVLSNTYIIFILVLKVQ